MLVNSPKAVFLSLPTTAQVQEVCKELIATSTEAGLVVIDCTSGDAAASEGLTKLLAEAGHHYVESPVSGGPRGAAAGSVTAMIAGHNQQAREFALEVVRSSYCSRGGLAVDLGGTPGAAHATKAVNNGLNAAHLLLGTEALAGLQAVYEVPAADALRAINASSGRSLQTQVRLPEEVLSRRFQYNFALGLMKKDSLNAAKILRAADRTGGT